MMRILFASLALLMLSVVVDAQEASDRQTSFGERTREKRTFLAAEAVSVDVPMRRASTRNEARSGDTLRIYPESQVLIGSGYSTLAGTPRNSAVLVATSMGDDEVALTRSSQDLEIDYDFKLIETYEDLARALSIDASASYKGLTGGASARFSLYRSARMTSRSVYVLVRLSMLSRVDQLSSIRLRDEALRLLRAGGSDAFFTTYGDAFVYRVGHGAELFALLEFQIREGQSKESISAGIDAQIGAFSAEVSFSSSLSELTENRQVKVQYAQTGGATGRPVDPDTFPPLKPSTGLVPSSGGILTITPSELEYRIRDFPHEVRQNPATAKVIWADVVDYYAASNRPLSLTLHDLTPVRWVLQDLAMLDRDLTQVRNTWWDFLSKDGSGASVDQPSLEDLFCLDDTLRRIHRTGEILISSPGLVQAVVDGIGGDVLPSPHALRRYVIELAEASAAYSTSAGERTVCDRFEDLNDFVDFIVTRKIPVRSTAPSRGDQHLVGTIAVGSRGGGRHRFTVTFSEAFQDVPVVLLTVTGNTASDADKFAVSTSNVTKTGFTADICRIPNPIDIALCIGWGNPAVAIQWAAVPVRP